MSTYCFHRQLSHRTRTIPLFLILAIVFSVNKSVATPILKTETDHFVYQNNDGLLPEDYRFDNFNTYLENSKKPYTILGKSLSNGKYDYVLNSIDSLPENEKISSEIISLKIATFIGKGDYSSAMSEFDNFKNLKDVSSQSFSLIADMLIKKGKATTAMLVCQSGLMRDIKSATLLYQMGYAHSLLSKTEKAIAYYEAALLASKNSIKDGQPEAISKALAISYYNTKTYDKAKNSLQDNSSIYNDSGIDILINAKYFVSNGDFEQAIALLNNSRKTSKYIEADLVKAQTYILNSQPQKALETLSGLDLELKNSKFKVMSELVTSLALLTNGRADLALDILKNIEHPKNVSNIHMLKALTYFSQDDKVNAIEELKQTSLPYSELSVLPTFRKHLEQSSIGPALSLAFFCIDQRYYDEALKIANALNNQSQDNVLIKFITAECYLQTGQFSLAINELTELINTFKGSYALKFYLAQAYSKAGMINEAKQMYKSLTDERPDFVLANIVHGQFLSSINEWKEAKKIYENGLNFTPNSPNLQIDLAWALIHLKEFENFENLIAIIENNTSVSSTSLLHLKGWFAYQNTNISKAQELLTEALETSPGDPEICFHLGMTMMKAGKEDIAKNLLEQSLLFEEQRNKYAKSIAGVVSFKK